MNLKNIKSEPIVIGAALFVVLRHRPGWLEEVYRIDLETGLEVFKGYLCSAPDPYFTPLSIAMAHAYELRNIDYWDWMDHAD